MMYTPQQLAGGATYSRGALIGNWKEDTGMDELKTSEYLARRSRGELALSRIAARERLDSKAVPHSFSADGTVRDGFTVMLSSAKTGTALATNVHRDIGWGTGNRAVELSRAAQPTASNTFVISKLPPTDAYYWLDEKSGDDAVVCYGEVFYICSNPSLRVDEASRMKRSPLYLASCPRGVSTGLQESQAVYMSEAKDVNAEWKIAPLDLGKTVLFDGRAVPANASVVLVHVASGTPLGAMSGAVVCGKDSTSAARGDTRTGTANHWNLVTSATSAAALDDRVFVEFSAAAVIDKIKRLAASRGEYGFRGLAKAFTIMAVDGILTRGDLKFGIKDMGVTLSDDEFNVVVNHFDPANRGVISIKSFMGTLRGAMPASRLGVVRAAYAQLERTGAVTLESIAMGYDAGASRAVAVGATSAEGALAAFLSHFATQGRGELVSFEEFAEYYADISATIADDAMFSAMMVNCWHLEGSTTQRRVLVVHADGSETVETIVDDLGLGPTPAQADVIARLASQGITDVKEIKF